MSMGPRLISKSDCPTRKCGIKFLMCCIKFFLEKNFFFLPTHQKKSQKVIGNDNIFFSALPIDRYKGHLNGSLLLNINLIINVNVLISIKALYRIDSHATVLKLSGIYHVVCYGKRLHHATLKWVVLQWNGGGQNFTRVAPCCEWKGVSFLKNSDWKGVGGPGVQPHTPVLFRT